MSDKSYHKIKIFGANNTFQRKDNWGRKKARFCFFPTLGKKQDFVVSLPLDNYVDSATKPCGFNS